MNVMFIRKHFEALHDRYDIDRKDLEEVSDRKGLQLRPFFVSWHGKFGHKHLKS